MARHNADEGQADHAAKAEPRTVVLAQEALAQGWTPEQVAQALRVRIRRDEHYLTYRRLQGHHTLIDAAIEADLLPLALAAHYLEHSLLDAGGEQYERSVR
jgi:hypothetical protein